MQDDASALHLDLDARAADLLRASGDADSHGVLSTAASLSRRTAVTLILSGSSGYV